MHLQANVAHYERASINSSRHTQPMRTGNHVAKPFASVLKGNTSPEPSYPTIVMVLDESCVVHRDLANCVMGEIKQFSSIVNLRVLLSNEGFHNVNLTYLVGLWVVCELGLAITKEKFLKHVGVASWFTRLYNAQNDFVSKERVVWVDIEGESNILETFKVIVLGKVFVVRAKQLFIWSPTFNEIMDVIYCSNDESKKGDAAKVGSKKSNCHVLNEDEESDVKRVSDTVFDEHEENNGNVLENSVNGKEQSSDPFNLYGLLKKHNMEEKLTDPNTSLSHPSGFTPDIERPEVDIHVTDSRGMTSSPRKSNGVNSRIMEETKPADIHTNSAGSKPNCSSQKGGSILEVLDDMIKVGQTMGFSMQGSLQDMENIIGSQRDREDCVSTLEASYLWGNGRFDHMFGDAIGDFNEVRYERDWMGSVFNVRGAQDFNSFISIAGLVDIQLEGYAFTWSDPSTAKMSKLDWFLVTGGFLSTFPHISALCLDKNLSDHQPILLHELFTNYGASPFKKKLQLLKKEGVTDEILLARLELTKQIHDIKVQASSDQMQKEKIQWAIEGDENSKYFHGIVNRKRVNLSVKGIMVDGEWVDEPRRVKEEFRSHFASRFQDPGMCHSRLNFRFPSRLTPHQIIELERPTVFLPNRQILDGPFIINELLSWCRHKKLQAMVFKVDFAKAYDSIRWDYLDDVLNSFGSGVKWWIKGSLTFGKASVLVNGCPTLEFQFHYGLKQGDPLAPCLFILVMESLHLSISRAEKAGIFLGIKIDYNVSLSYLFYADDVVFIGEWSGSNLRGIIQMLHCFSLASGLKINLQKSQLLGVGVTNDSVIAAAGSIGCSIIKTPFKYLGVMKWKIGTLSIRGRLTLIKSVLGSTPIYSMSLYKVPKTVLHTMEAIRRDSFNGSQSKDRNISWIKWSKVLAAKKYGGLGVSSYYALNRALLFKWDAYTGPDRCITSDQVLGAEHP
nr:RNA-directed DNA polymerase, eukaryota [Tanacetum cinerariifolium]